MTDRKNSAVYQKALDLSVEIYRLIRKLPPEEIHCLSEELPRTACSVALSSEEDLAAAKIRGKLAALETLLLICVRLNYLKEMEIKTALNLCAEIEGMSNSL